MATWQRQQQEQDGSHRFEGRFYFTKKVYFELSFEEIMFIYNDLKAFVLSNNGGNYFQRYADLENPDRQLFVIDIPEQNCFNLLFNSEFGKAR